MRSARADFVILRPDAAVLFDAVIAEDLLASTMLAAHYAFLRSVFATRVVARQQILGLDCVACALAAAPQDDKVRGPISRDFLTAA